jgi:Fe-S-cluster containining protein
MQDRFPCTACGSCCKRINIAVKSIGENTEDNPLYFPYSWDESGRCEMLTKDNFCKVYDKRPTLCNVDKVMELFDIPKKEFYEINIEACNSMMDEDGIDESFRIKTQNNKK